MPDTVDLRSDTVTRPTRGMRAAMAAADVGDDVYGEDPTVNALQDEVAAMFGRDAALFTPTGVMANQIALRVLAAPGSEVVLEADAHIVAYEAGAHAALGGLQFRTVTADRGILTRAVVEPALRPRSFPYTENSVVAIENTTNRSGGTIYDLATLDDLRALCDEHELALYMDGARIFNAVVASGSSPETYGSRVAALSFCVSKGLGAPVGSLLVGDADLVAEAKAWRRRYGGAMRQVGVLAAAGRYALQHHVDRLADDHENARTIARIVADAHPDAVDPDGVETNIVYVATGARPAADIIRELGDEGIRVGAMGDHLLRLVTHLDVDVAGARRAGEALARALTA